MIWTISFCGCAGYELCSYTMASYLEDVEALKAEGRPSDVEAAVDKKESPNRSAELTTKPPLTRGLTKEDRSAPLAIATNSAVAPKLGAAEGKSTSVSAPSYPAKSAGSEDKPVLASKSITTSASAKVAVDSKESPKPPLSRGLTQGGPDYWVKLRQASRKCFGGLDVMVEISSGIERRTYDNEMNPYTEATLSIPLFSRSERQKNQDARGRFLEHGAELLREFEESQAMAEVLEEEVAILRTALLQGGQEAIKNFFNIKEAVAKNRVNSTAAKRKLDGWLDSCGRE